MTTQQPLTTNVGTRLPPVAVTPSVYFAYGLKATEFVFLSSDCGTSEDGDNCIRMHLRANLTDQRPDERERKVRTAPSGMLRRVALVRTDVSEELRATIIRVKRIGELGTLA
jgi:hypothetical protein